MSSIIVEHEEYSRVMNSAEFILDVLHNSTEGPVFNAGVFYFENQIPALQEYTQGIVPEEILRDDSDYYIIQYSIVRPDTDTYRLEIDFEDAEFKEWIITKEIAEQIVRYNCTHDIEVFTCDSIYFNEDTVLRKYAEEHGYITKQQD